MPPVQVALDTRSKSTHTFRLFNFDGIEDTTTPVLITNPAPGVVTAEIDPANNRLLVLTGQSAGSATVALNTSPGVAGGALQYVATIAAAPNLSRLEHVSSTPAVPK